MFPLTAVHEGKRFTMFARDLAIGEKVGQNSTADTAQNAVVHEEHVVVRHPPCRRQIERAAYDSLT